MPRVWGRLVSATLSDSMKLAQCTERAALVYGAFTTPKHDGQGRLEVDDVSMLSMCGRFALAHEWTLKDMAEIRDQFEKVGLWRLYRTVDGRLCAEVVDWQRHQRLDKIKRESALTSESGGSSGVSSGGSEVGSSGVPEGVSSGGEGGESGGGVGTLKGQVKLREENETKEKGCVPHIELETRDSSERARVKASSVPKRTHTQEISGGGRGETASLLEPQIIAEFKSVHPLGERYVPRLKHPQDYDRVAIEGSAHALQLMTDRVPFWRRSLASLPAHRQTLEAAIGCLNNPAIVNGPSVTNGRRDEGPPILDDRARALGITNEELRRRYEAGEYTQKVPPKTMKPIPVLAEEEIVDPSRLSGMERVGAIVARAIPTPAKDLA